MKSRILQLLICLSLAFSFVAAPTILTGCNTAQKTVAFKSLSSIAQAAEAGRQAYNIARVKGKITADQEVKVLQQWADYQAAMLVAVKAARLDYNAPPPPELAALVSTFIDSVKLIAK